MVFKPEDRFNRAKCNSCGICVSACPESAIETDSSDGITAFTSACIGCAHCGCYCPLNCFDLPLAKSDMLPQEDQIQNLYEARRSTRKFLDRRIDEEVLRSLLEPVGFSPTGQNAQGVTVDVLIGRDNIDSLILNPIVRLVRVLDCFRLLTLFAGPAGKIIKKLRSGEDVICWNAPCVLLFRAPARNVTGKTDSVIAATMVSIKAEALGLGSLWNGIVQIISPILRVRRSQAVLCVGYPALKRYQQIPERTWNRSDVSRSKQDARGDHRED